MISLATQRDAMADSATSEKEPQVSLIIIGIFRVKKKEQLGETADHNNWKNPPQHKLPCSLKNHPSKQAWIISLKGAPHLIPLTNYSMQCAYCCNCGIAIKCLHQIVKRRKQNTMVASSPLGWLQNLFKTSLHKILIIRRRKI